MRPSDWLVAIIKLVELDLYGYEYHYKCVHYGQITVCHTISNMHCFVSCFDYTCITQILELFVKIRN